MFFCFFLYFTCLRGEKGCKLKHQTVSLNQGWQTFVGTFLQSFGGVWGKCFHTVAFQINPKSFVQINYNSLPYQDIGKMINISQPVIFLREKKTASQVMSLRVGAKEATKVLLFTTFQSAFSPTKMRRQNGLKHNNPDIHPCPFVIIIFPQNGTCPKVFHTFS